MQCIRPLRTAPEAILELDCTVILPITPCNTVQYSTVQYSTVQYFTVQYSTVQSTVCSLPRSPKGQGPQLLQAGEVENSLANFRLNWSQQHGGDENILKIYSYFTLS